MGNINPICQDFIVQSEKNQAIGQEQVLDQFLQFQEPFQNKQKQMISPLNQKNFEQKYSKQRVNNKQNKRQKIKLHKKSNEQSKQAKDSKTHNREYSQKQKQINNLIHQSHQFFKRLKIVEKYQQRYDDLFEFDKQISQSVKFKDEEHLQFYKFLVGILLVVQRLYRTGKHKNVIKLIYELDKEYTIKQDKQTLSKIQNLKQSVLNANLQFLDMLFYKLPPFQDLDKNKLLQKDRNWNKQVNVKKLFKNLNISHIIDVKKIIMSKSQELQELQEKSYYQNCKKAGFDIYKQNKVCFYILAGASDDLFWKNSPSKERNDPIKQLTQFNLPSSQNILSILLSRYDSFASLLQVKSLSVVILTNNSKFQKIQQFISLNKSLFKKLQISVLSQAEQAVLDRQGNLVLNDKKQVVFFPNGNGDLWDYIVQQDQDFATLQKLKDNEFQYIQIIGTNNCLQHCFDCFMMGICDSKRLKWGTKIIQVQNSHIGLTQAKKNMSLKNSRVKDFHKQQNFKRYDQNQKDNIQKTKVQTFTQRSKISPIICNFTQIEKGEVQSKIFLTENDNIYKRDPNQLGDQDYNGCKYIFTNHSILSVSFIQKVLKSQKWKEERLYRKKCVYLNKKHPQLISFQSDYTDIFNFTQNLNNQQKIEDIQQPDHKFFIFKHQRQNQFHPFQFGQKGMFDIQTCSRAISNLHLSYLDLQKFHGQQCYIDPRISLQGQNLQEVKEEIKLNLEKGSLIFPLHISQNI